MNFTNIQIAASANALIDAVNGAVTSLLSFLNNTGGAVTGLISAITGFACLFVVAKGIWSITSHRNEDFWSDNAKTIATLVAITIFAGLVSAAFFNS